MALIETNMLHHVLPIPTAPSRVVVMGAGGFVGNAIAARLESRGVRVLPLSRSGLDLMQPKAAESLARLLRKDDVFVAVSALAPCKTATMLRDNMTIALTMIRALALVDVGHVVNVSSDAVYADLAEPLTETSSTASDTLHGAMHLAREVMFRSETKAPLLILRPSLLYGPGDPHNSYGPNRFRRLVNQGREITLFGEGEERRDHVFIDDLAELATRAIFLRSEGVLNVASGTVASFREIAEMVVSLSSRSVAINSSRREGPMPHNGYRPFDIALCRRAFPDFAYSSLEEGLARAQAAETSHPRS